MIAPKKLPSPFTGNEDICRNSQTTQVFGKLGTPHTNLVSGPVLRPFQTAWLIESSRDSIQRQVGAACEQLRPRLIIIAENH
jgi:hypothetical protein